MSHSTPPKSKMTPRQRLVIPAPLCRNRRRLGVLVLGERDPAAPPQAVLVDLAALLAGGAVTLELRHRVVDTGFGPLLVGLSAPREDTERQHHEHESSHNARMIP